MYDSYYIHPFCEQKLHLIKEPRCYHCGKPLRNEEAEFCYDCKQKGPVVVERGYALFEYTGIAKRMIYRYKYSNRSGYGCYFARMAKMVYGSWICSQGIEQIISVPMSKRKQRQRGYNQAEEFAKALGKELQIPVDQNRVLRIKNTKALKTMNPLERKKCLKNAFKVEKTIVEYRKILLVDDIYTTGSTIEAVAEELKKAGAEKVYFLTICIGKDTM